MEKGRIGVSLETPTPAQTVEMIERAESLGVQRVWLTTGGARPDGLTVFAAAAARTRAIGLGTSIMPIFPRHPLVAAQQAQVVANLAPGRLVLGIGPSHRSQVTAAFGLPFQRPLERLREYVTVLKSALQGGAVDFDGNQVRAHAEVPHPSAVPVMISALQAGSFRMAGAIADGAISWICPARYLREVGLPALREGAAQANRKVPPLIGHCFVVVTEDDAEATRAALARISNYPRYPFYARMFVAAGFPEAERGEWSEAMFRSVVIHGNEATVAAGLRTFLSTSGANELIASIVPVGSNGRASQERAMRLIATL